MSDHGERPRDPDPAALAELQRAFGEDDAESGATDNGASAMITERIDAVSAEADPQASVVTSPVDEVVADRSGPCPSRRSSRPGSTR